MVTGRPSHVPTDKTRNQVEAMSSYGIPQEDIARVLNICKNTLRKHYKEELETAETKANAMVAGQLYKNCMAGKEASIFFWLKTRAGYKETSKQELSGTIDTNHTISDDDKELLKAYLKTKGA